MKQCTKLLENLPWNVGALFLTSGRTDWRWCCRALEFVTSSSWLPTHTLHFYSSYLISCLLAVSPTRLNCLGAWRCSTYHLCLVLSMVNVHTLNVHRLDIALILIPAEGMDEYWPECIFFIFKNSFVNIYLCLTLMPPLWNAVQNYIFYLRFHCIWFSNVPQW